MKLILIFLLINLTVVSVYSQEYQYVPFPDSNAVWSEVYWKSVFEPHPRWVYNKYALFNEDTVITGLTYHKLFYANVSEITMENSTCNGGIREDSLKKIWFKDFNLQHEYSFLNENGEILLYDFNLEVNDTIWNSKNYTNIVGSSFLTVSKIDTIKIEKSFRKVFSFYEITWEVWIEGIGKMKGLIFPSGGLPTNGMDNDLVCFHQNDTLLYYNSGMDNIYDSCVPSFILSGIALLPNPDVKVYPNPVTGESLYFEGLDFEKLDLFDINGNLILSNDISGLDKYVLDVSAITSGVYIYQLKKQGLVPTGGKLIIP